MDICKLAEDRLKESKYVWTVNKYYDKIFFRTSFDFADDQSKYASFIVSSELVRDQEFDLISYLEDKRSNLNRRK